jgi:RNA polymerase sigma-70 factor (ECF subfamily)
MLMKSSNMNLMDEHNSQPSAASGTRTLAEHPTVSSLLLGEVQRMDPAAWSRLVDTFGGIVYRWCRTSGVSEDDAADVVQDVFASVARGIVGFQRQKDQGSFRSWLATITRNRVRDHFRRQAAQQSPVGGTDAWQALEQHPDLLESTICSDNAQHAVVHRVLASVRAEFEPATWNAFWSVTVENRSAAEVAQATGLGIASVYQAKSRVLRRLRQRLTELPE